MDPRTPYAIDTNALPWEERFNERIGRALYRKVLYCKARSRFATRAPLADSHRFTPSGLRPPPP